MGLIRKNLWPFRLVSGTNASTRGFIEPRNTTTESAAQQRTSPFAWGNSDSRIVLRSPSLPQVLRMVASQVAAPLLWLSVGPAQAQQQVGASFETTSTMYTQLASENPIVGAAFKQERSWPVGLPQSETVTDGSNQALRSLFRQTGRPQAERGTDDAPPLRYEYVFAVAMMLAALGAGGVWVTSRHPRSDRDAPIHDELQRLRQLPWYYPPRFNELEAATKHDSTAVRRTAFDLLMEHVRPEPTGIFSWIGIYRPDDVMQVLVEAAAREPDTILQSCMADQVRNLVQEVASIFTVMEVLPHLKGKGERILVLRALGRWLSPKPNESTTEAKLTDQEQSKLLDVVLGIAEAGGFGNNESNQACFEVLRTLDPRALIHRALSGALDDGDSLILSQVLKWQLSGKTEAELKTILDTFTPWLQQKDEDGARGTRLTFLSGIVTVPYLWSYSMSTEAAHPPSSEVIRRIAELMVRAIHPGEDGHNQRVAEAMARGATHLEFLAHLARAGWGSTFEASPFRYLVGSEEVLELVRRTYSDDEGQTTEWRDAYRRVLTLAALPFDRPNYTLRVSARESSIRQAMWSDTSWSAMLMQAVLHGPKVYAQQLLRVLRDQTGMVGHDLHILGGLATAGAQSWFSDHPDVARSDRTKFIEEALRDPAVADEPLRMALRDLTELLGGGLIFQDSTPDEFFRALADLAWAVSPEVPKLLLEANARLKADAESLGPTIPQLILLTRRLAWAMRSNIESFNGLFTWWLSLRLSSSGDDFLGLTEVLATAGQTMQRLPRDPATEQWIYPGFVKFLMETQGTAAVVAATYQSNRGAVMWGNQRANEVATWIEFLQPLMGYPFDLNVNALAEANGVDADWVGRMLPVLKEIRTPEATRALLLLAVHADLRSRDRKEVASILKKRETVETTALVAEVLGWRRNTAENFFPGLRDAGSSESREALAGVFFFRTSDPIDLTKVWAEAREFLVTSHPDHVRALDTTTPNRTYIPLMMTALGSEKPEIASAAWEGLLSVRSGQRQIAEKLYRSIRDSAMVRDNLAGMLFDESFQGEVEAAFQSLIQELLRGSPDTLSSGRNPIHGAMVLPPGERTQEELQVRILSVVRLFSEATSEIIEERLNGSTAGLDGLALLNALQFVDPKKAEQWASSFLEKLPKQGSMNGLTLKSCEIVTQQKGEDALPVLESVARNIDDTQWDEVGVLRVLDWIKRLGTEEARDLLIKLQTHPTRKVREIAAKCVSEFKYEYR
jgi:hypothetical protein